MINSKISEYTHKGDSPINERVYREIVRRIMSGELKPDQRLVEEELADSFEVSRTPIREVLLRLERDGLVSRIHNRGARVTRFSADDVDELFEIRKALECLAIKKAQPNLKLSDLLYIEYRLTELIKQRGQNWLEEHAELDLRFHRLIYEGSGNRRLIAQLDNLAFLIHSLRLISNSNEKHALPAAQEHIEIIKAIMRHDAAEAEQLLSAHLEAAKRRVIEFSFVKADSSPMRLSSDRSILTL